MGPFLAFGTPNIVTFEPFINGLSLNGTEGPIPGGGIVVIFNGPISVCVPSLKCKVAVNGNPATIPFDPVICNEKLFAGDVIGRLLLAPEGTIIV